MKRSTHPLMLYVGLYRPDGNPLRRRSDRVESALVLAGLLLVLAGLWPAVLAGRAAYLDAVHDLQAHPAVRVVATLSQDAPSTRVSFTEVPAAQPKAWAQWRTPQGMVRGGVVPVPAMAKASSTVPVWLDAAGASGPPPPDEAELVCRGLATGVLIVLVTALLAATAFLGVRWTLDRIRYRQWGTDWARTDRPGGRSPA